MIQIKLTDKAKELILNRAYSIQYGARPVKRYLQKYIETEISRMIIKGSLKDNDTITIDVENGELSIKV